MHNKEIEADIAKSGQRRLIWRYVLVIGPSFVDQLKG